MSWIVKVQFLIRFCTIWNVFSTHVYISSHFPLGLNALCAVASRINDLEDSTPNKSLCFFLPFLSFSPAFQKASPKFRADWILHSIRTQTIAGRSFPDAWWLCRSAANLWVHSVSVETILGARERSSRSSKYIAINSERSTHTMYIFVQMQLNIMAPLHPAPSTWWKQHQLKSNYGFFAMGVLTQTWANKNPYRNISVNWDLVPIWGLCDFGLGITDPFLGSISRNEKV